MNLFHAGFLVDTELTGRLAPEVLHRVGDINFSPVDVRFFETLIQQLSSRPDEWTTLLVFLLAGLFPDQHNFDLRLLCAGPSIEFSEYGLRCILIEITTPAVLNCFPQNGQCPVVRYKRRCTPVRA